MVLSPLEWASLTNILLHRSRISFITLDEHMRPFHPIRPSQFARRRRLRCCVRHCPVQIYVFTTPSTLLGCYPWTSPITMTEAQTVFLHFLQRSRILSIFSVDPLTLSITRLRVMVSRPTHPKNLSGSGMEIGSVI